MNSSDAAREQTVDARIRDVERRLEIRRGRIEQDLDEVKERLSRKTTWVPMAAAIGALAVGYAVARAQSGDRQARRLDVPRGGLERKGGIVAVTLGMVAGAARFALSPQGRALWQVFRRGVARGRKDALSPVT